ncbi:hypothetical protein BDR26DRAFT_669430 [Obelidium mucronatum]|nr:hypothetical protein BDR26DRAFT_669430 [Obelidium mucronatum]
MSLLLCGTNYDAAKQTCIDGGQVVACRPAGFVVRCDIGTCFPMAPGMECKQKPIVPSEVVSLSGRAATTTVSSLSSAMAANIDIAAPTTTRPTDNRLAIGLGVGISSIVLLLGAIITCVMIRKRKAKIGAQSNVEVPHSIILDTRGKDSLPLSPAASLPKPPLSLLFLHDTDFGPSLSVTQQIEQTISSSLSSRYKVSVETVGIAGLPEEIEIARSELDRFDCVLVAVHKVDRFLIYREGKIVHRLKEICSQNKKRFVPIVYDSVPNSVSDQLTGSFSLYEGCLIVYFSLSYALLPNQNSGRWTS